MTVHVRLTEETKDLVCPFIRTPRSNPPEIGAFYQVEIWHLKPGVEVLSRCERTGELGYRKILSVYEHLSAKVLDLSYYCERLKCYISILVTGNHPFWVINKGWVNVIDLREGDRFLTADGSGAHFGSLDEYRYPDTVYNIEVEGFHTYFIESGIWVHNKNQQISTEVINPSKFPDAIAQRGAFDGKPFEIEARDALAKAGFDNAAASSRAEIGPRNLLGKYELDGTGNPIRETGVKQKDETEVATQELLSLVDEPLRFQKPYLTPIYRSEVQAFHTYYVEDEGVGVWVHNTGCDAKGAIQGVGKKLDLEQVCFNGDTPVLREGGSFTKIENLQVGSFVMSRCEKTVEMMKKRVLKIFEHSAKEYVLKCKTGPQYAKEWGGLESGYIYVTEEHPFWVQGKGWVPVRELRPGDSFVTHSGDPASVEYVLTPEEFAYRHPQRSVPCASPVYNLEVEDFNTYFVGTAGIWVHNCNNAKIDVQVLKRW
ncbi:MAG: hypothetical protein C4K60_11375 [Ideonella sp. MAG2]|nr:MAG: hypothetical protein C4K60_11375 [Ideonella sp. MAG2]